MHIIILLLFLVMVLYGPQWWARAVLARYSREDERFPETGEQFARRLLDRFELRQVRVEPSPVGDHYDPKDRVVRLTEDNLRGRSLTAVVVAAHEVGHALQDAQGYRPLALRGQLVELTRQAERFGSFAMLALPVLTVITRTPLTAVVTFLIGLAMFATPAVVHAITLPVEWDASFRRALPLLQTGEYLDARQLPAARRILKACALTYVASSLASLLNLWRWLRMLRR
jgi:hypothetical protein